MSKVFVSYSRDDLRKVKHVIKTLRPQGFEFWLDVDNIETGEYWPQKIAEAIIGCSRFLLFMSTASMKSDNVRDEIQIAYENKKKRVILRLDDSQLPPKLNIPLIGIQRTEYSAANWEEKIVSALGGKVIERKTNTSHVAPKNKAKSQTLRPLSPQKTISELEDIFSENGYYYKDQCDAVLVKLGDLGSAYGNHWLNQTFNYQELIPRVYFLEKIEKIRNLVKEFQDTCPPGSPLKRQSIHNELNSLLAELKRRTNQ